MSTKTILCLANSRKRGGRCVAGLAADGSGWIRAVSPRDDGTLYPPDYQFASGGEPCPLDLIEIPFESHRPRKHHPEDWLITSEKWRRLPRASDETSAELLKSHVEAGPALLRGTADRISFASIEEQPMQKSLALAMPRAIELYRKKSLRGTWLARGRFQLASATYDLGLTDPVWVDNVLRAEKPTVIEPGERQLLLTISLSEMFEGAYFKLIATLLLAPAELAALLTKP